MLKDPSRYSSLEFCEHFANISNLFLFQLHAQGGLPVSPINIKQSSTFQPGQIQVAITKTSSKLLSCILNKPPGDVII